MKLCMHLQVVIFRIFCAKNYEHWLLRYVTEEKLDNIFQTHAATTDSHSQVIQRL